MASLRVDTVEDFVLRRGLAHPRLEGNCRCIDRWLYSRRVTDQAKTHDPDRLGLTEARNRKVISTCIHAHYRTPFDIGDCVCLHCREIASFVDKMLLTKNLP
jgi:hypothetical protein